MSMDEDTAPPAEAARSESAHQPPSEDHVFLAKVVGAAGDRDKLLLRRLLKDMDPADLADVIEHLPGEAMRHALRLIGEELPAEFLANLSWERREEVLAILPAALLAARSANSTPTTRSRSRRTSPTSDSVKCLIARPMMCAWSLKKRCSSRKSRLAASCSANMSLRLRETVSAM